MSGFPAGWDVSAACKAASGATPEDVRMAMIEQLATHVRTLTPHNARSFLDHLPDDRDVIAVQQVLDWEVRMRFAA